MKLIWSITNIVKHKKKKKSKAFFLRKWNPSKFSENKNHEKELNYNFICTRKIRKKQLLWKEIPLQKHKSNGNKILMSAKMQGKQWNHRNVETKHKNKGLLKSTIKYNKR